MTPDRAALFALARHAFPDGHVLVDDALIDSLIETMQRRYDPHFAALGVEPPHAGLRPTDPAAPQHEPGSFYMVHARHTRSPGSDPPYSAFVGHLPMVRVALGHGPLSTPIGDIGAMDALLPDLAAATRYAAFHGRRAPERVDLITAPRVAGRRFAAVAAYLFYNDGVQTAYVLEAGLSQGAPRVLFWGAAPGITIEQQTGYNPTPMASENHWYRGRLDVFEDEPKRLVIDVSVARGGTPHMRIEAEFERRASPPVNDPALYFLEAVERVALLTQGMGIHLPDVPDVVRDALALVARTLPWETAP